MTTSGWMIMLVSITVISSFFFYSLYLAITKESADLHSTLDETPDIEED